MIEVSMSTIRELREAAGMRQMELATAAKVAIGTISRMENGYLTSRNSFERVCEVLGVDPQTVTGVQIKRLYHNSRKASS